MRKFLSDTVIKREKAHLLDEKSILASKIETSWAVGDSILHSVPTRFLAPIAASNTGSLNVFQEASVITIHCTVCTKKRRKSCTYIFEKKNQFSTIFSYRKSTRENRFPCWVSVLTPFGEKQLWFIKFCTKLSHILRQDHTLHCGRFFSKKY